MIFGVNELIERLKALKLFPPQISVLYTMTRRQAREHLFRMMFRIEFNKREELREQADFYLESLDNLNEEDIESLGSKDIKKLKERYIKIVEKLTEIDEILANTSTGWKLDRMGKVDLAVMRIAIYEIKFDQDIPDEVAINEAVEIAKKYGEETSGSFVNGVLAKLLKSN